MTNKAKVGISSIQRILMENVSTVCCVEYSSASCFYTSLRTVKDNRRSGESRKGHLSVETGPGNRSNEETDDESK